MRPAVLDLVLVQGAEEQIRGEQDCFPRCRLNIILFFLLFNIYSASLGILFMFPAASPLEMMSSVNLLPAV